MSKKKFGLLQFEILKKYLTTVIRTSSTKTEVPDSNSVGKGAVLLFEPETGDSRHAMVGKIVHNYNLRLKEAERKIFLLKLHPDVVSSSNIQDLDRIPHEGAIRVIDIGTFSLAGLEEGMNEICLLCALQMDLLVDYAFISQALKGDMKLFEQTFNDVFNDVMC